MWVVFSISREGLDDEIAVFGDGEGGEIIARCTNGAGGCNNGCIRAEEEGRR
jgi:hypothetical protein